MYSQTLNPILKWAGGKSKLLPMIKELLPEDFDDRVYNEPFLGGGSVAFGLHPKDLAYLSDANAELINFYEVVKSEPSRLISEYYSLSPDKETFMAVRSWDRGQDLETIPPLLRAARFLYLNKVCFNGLYRVNKEGYFNTSWGKKTTLPTLNTANIYRVSDFLQEALVRVHHADFMWLMDTATEGDFYYIDPPYLQEGVYNQYTKEEFDLPEHQKLAEACRTIDSRGGKFMASNLDNPQVRELYEGFNFHEVNVNHVVGGTGLRRKFANELIITNY